MGIAQLSSLLPAVGSLREDDVSQSPGHSSPTKLSTTLVEDSCPILLISLYLLSEFLKFIPIRLIRHKDTEIVVTGNRTRVRLPDLMVLTEELFAAISGKRATITQDMPSSALVVEVVSPGKVNEDRDYRYKRSESAARGIPEYWIVDPSQRKITVLTLVDGLYEEAIFQGSASLISTNFPNLKLTAAQVLGSPM